MWAGIIAALKALPALLAALKGMLMLWKQIRDSAQEKEDNKEIEDEKNSAHNGGRPFGS